LARVLIVGGGDRGRELAAALEADGLLVRGTTADPAQVLSELEGVAIVCWLAGPDRLESVLDKLVDTPVRGFVYEGTDGAEVVRRYERRRIPIEIVNSVSDVRAAVGRLLSPS
jgi:hypothetical protein